MTGLVEDIENLAAKGDADSIELMIGLGCNNFDVASHIIKKLTKIGDEPAINGISRIRTAHNLEPAVAEITNINSLHL